MILPRQEPFAAPLCKVRSSETLFGTSAFTVFFLVGANLLYTNFWGAQYFSGVAPFQTTLTYTDYYSKSLTTGPPLPRAKIHCQQCFAMNKIAAIPHVALVIKDILFCNKTPFPNDYTTAWVLSIESG